MQILESIGETTKTTLFKEGAKPNFYPCRFPQRRMHFAPFAEAILHSVFRFKLLTEKVYLLAGNLLYHSHQFSYTVSVYGPAKFHLCFDFISFGHSYFPHIIPEPGDLYLF